MCKIKIFIKKLWQYLKGPGAIEMGNDYRILNSSDFKIRMEKQGQNYEFPLNPFKWFIKNVDLVFKENLVNY